MISLPDYHSVEHIYESNVSVVYHARRMRDDLPVFLKVLKGDYPSPRDIARYHREHDIITRLGPVSGVVSGLGLEKYLNAPVIILEDFGGESLNRLMKSKKFSVGMFLGMAVRIAEILGDIHAADVIHKDINPANIIMNPTNMGIRIIDFGIASVLPRETPTLKSPDVLEGTLAYISPEQTGRMNRKLDYRSDYYSLGATFYEMLTGRLPFEASDPMELVHCHIAKQPAPPSEINPEIPGTLSNIVLKLLSKNAEDRYQSALGIRADLGECLKQFEQTGNVTDFPLGRRDMSDRFEIPQKLYGRRNEIGTLMAAFDRVADGQSGMMMVSGFSGIGKTALIQEIHKPVTRLRGFFISGKFDQFQRNIPYMAVVNAFSDLIRQLLAETEKRLSAWRDMLVSALGANGQVMIDLIPELESIIGKQPAIPELPSDESRNRFHLVFQHFTEVFASPRHPLVVFADDLQWADSGSLELISHLMQQVSRHLLIIGAFRDNEVGPGHPLVATLEGLKQEGVIVNDIRLDPLPVQAAGRLISETFHCSSEDALPLTELVCEKTGGNPFFMSMMLKSLYDEKRIDFDHREGGWRWDLEKIRTVGVSDNVVELMADRIQKLPENTRTALQYAACVGNRFSLSTLSQILEKSKMETVGLLTVAVSEGLIFPTDDAWRLIGFSDEGDDAAWRFVHDRIQQAAYSLIPAGQKRATHLRIGRMLLDNTPEGLRKEKIFDIVNQLNQGAALIKDREEKERVAQLNLVAGKRAKASAAYAPAFDYLKTGIGLLDEKNWETHYELCLDIHTETAEAAYLSGDFEQMEHFLEKALENARTLLDKMKAYDIRIMSCFARDDLLLAVRTALPVLGDLGVRLSEKAGKIHVILGLLKTKLALAGKSPETLASLPEMSDPHKLAAMNILFSVAPASHFLGLKLTPLICFERVRLSVKHGNTAKSAAGYAIYGSILCGVLGAIDAGYGFGELALKVIDHFHAEELKPRIHLLFQVFIRHWKVHLRETGKPLLEAYQSGLEKGDLVYAATSAQCYCWYIFAYGGNLEKLERKIATYSNAVSKLKQESSVHFFLMMHQLVHNLMGRSDTRRRLVGEHFDEEKMLPVLEKARLGTGLFHMYLAKMILLYLFHDYERAFEISQETEKHVESVNAMFSVPMFHFYDALICLALYSESDGAIRKDYGTRLKKRIGTRLKKLKKWAGHAPMNHLHKYTLVMAEQARVLGKHAEAGIYYDRAVILAEENKYLNEQALGLELAGKFHMEREQPRIARMYLRDAHYAYQRWGADAKVRHMEETWPDMVASHVIQQAGQNPAITITSTSMASGSDSLFDMGSVLKASQAISGEIRLIRLMEIMMSIMVENSGAQKGVLFMEKDGKLVAEAEASLDKDGVSVLQSTPLDDPGLADRIPVSVIHYVARTHEDVVLDDAVGEGPFTNDPGVVKMGLRSVLCAPIRSQNKVAGIIYLENRLTTGAFTPERLKTLSILSAQAAISIRNARTYQELDELNKTLDQKVVERTRALNESMEKIEDANKKIMSSIRYATKIQRSLMPNPDTVRERFPDSFVIWMPRDEVGGDILLADFLDSGSILAVIDCTGHGVPGAFMTMIVSSAMKRITHDEKCDDPAAILKRLNYIVKTTLQQDTEYALSDDGLDAGICFVTNPNRDNERHLIFSGAKTPLFHLHHDELTDIKGDRQSIGYKKSDPDFNFANHTFLIKPGMRFYMSTDGYWDQIGGPKKISFGKKRFRQLIMENSEKSFDQQKDIFIHAFEEYRGDEERRDDLTLVGFGFS